MREEGGNMKWTRQSYTRHSIDRFTGLRVPPQKVWILFIVASKLLAHSLQSFHRPLAVIFPANYVVLEDLEQGSRIWPKGLLYILD